MPQTLFYANVFNRYLVGTFEAASRHFGDICPSKNISPAACSSPYLHVSKGACGASSTPRPSCGTQDCCTGAMISYLTYSSNKEMHGAYDVSISIFPLLFFFPWFFVLTLFTRSGVFYFFFLFSSSFFSSAGHLACGGGARQIVSPNFRFHFFLFSLSICLLCFVSSLIVSFRFSIS